MSEGLQLRNAKLEELRKLKSRRINKVSDSEPSENHSVNTSQIIKETVSIENPSNPQSVVHDSETEKIKKEILKIPYPEIEELVIKQLKIQLEILEKNESVLLRDSEILRQENIKIKSDRQIFLDSHQDLKKLCEGLQHELTVELENVKSKQRHVGNPKNHHIRQAHSQEIQEIP